MKIFVSHARALDYEQELYVPIRLSELNNTHDFYLPHEDDRSVNTKEEIGKSDLFIIEATHPATGVGVELGWAESMNIPILCIHKEGVKISGSIKYLTDNIYSYKDNDEMLQIINNYIQEN